MPNVELIALDWEVIQRRDFAPVHQQVVGADRPTSTNQSGKINYKAPKWDYGLKIGLWNVQSCYSEWKINLIIEECSQRKLNMVVLNETRPTQQK